MPEKLDAAKHQMMGWRADGPIEMSFVLLRSINTRRSAMHDMYVDAVLLCTAPQLVEQCDSIVQELALVDDNLELAGALASSESALHFRPHSAAEDTLNL